MALVLGAGLVTACDPADTVTRPDPDETATALADAFGTGDFSAVTFADGTTADEVGKEYAEVVDGLGDLTPSVTADTIETDGSAAAELTWTWPVGGREWTTPPTRT